MTRSVHVRVLAAVALSVVSACGGDSGTGPSQPEVRTNTQTVAPGLANLTTLTVTRNASVEAVANWNNPVNDIDLYATVGSCPLLSNSCTILTRAESTTAKPERINFAATPNNTYQVWALNTGPGTDSVTVTLTLR